MKRLISLFLATVMMLTLTVCVNAKAEVWDGSIAKGFASGKGTADDPYIIANGAQLAYLSYQVAKGVTFNSKYVELSCDIYLNDETFTFEPDTGLVKVSDGVATAYLSTEIPGDDSGDNTAFDQNSGGAGVWYTSPSRSAKGEYGGKLNAFTPIGNLDNCFEGHFDGRGHTVYGLYINSIDNYQGLFGKFSDTVKDLSLMESYVCGKGWTGGIAGSAGEVSACYSSAIVVGVHQIGGIVGIGTVKNSRADGVASGSLDAGGVIGRAIMPVTSCVNQGRVCGSITVGGVAGAGAVNDSYNIGNVSGQNNVGGVVGSGSATNCHNISSVIGDSFVGGVAGAAGSLKNVYNTGKVVGTGSGVGGVAGSANDNIINSYNTGEVTGAFAVGGVCGNGEVRISNSYNTGAVTATGAPQDQSDDVGGIMGFARNDILNCYNTGTVSGADAAGGIVGYSFREVTVSGSNNLGTVIGAKNTGGIVGLNSGNVTRCYNGGNVTGTDNVGGVIGHSLPYSTVKPKLADCYNYGSVSGGNMVGGIVGFNEMGFINDSYNRGVISGSGSNVGAVAGRQGGSVDGSYYLAGCATDGSGTVQNGKGTADKGAAAKDPEGRLVALTEEQMSIAASYEKFDFDKVWVMDSSAQGCYPTVYKDSGTTFNDIVKGAWYKKSVDYVLTKGLMSGVSVYKFSPEGTITRAMVVTVLYRLDGSPEISAGSPFTDLKDAWYKDAVAWAFENQIVNGMSPTVFAPDGKITREQLATILYRYTEYKELERTASADISAFPDVDKVSSWALDAIKWANAEGLINGTNKNGADYLDPTGNATRAQVATILMRYCENVA